MANALTFECHRCCPSTRWDGPAWRRLGVVAALAGLACGAAGAGALPFLTGNGQPTAGRKQVPDIQALLGKVLPSVVSIRTRLATGGGHRERDGNQPRRRCSNQCPPRERGRLDYRDALRHKPLAACSPQQQRCRYQPGPWAKTNSRDALRRRRFELPSPGRAELCRRDPARGLGGQPSTTEIRGNGFGEPARGAGRTTALRAWSKAVPAVSTCFPWPFFWLIIGSGAVFGLVGQRWRWGGSWARVRARSISQQRWADMYLSAAVTTTPAGSDRNRRPAWAGSTLERSSVHERRDQQWDRWPLPASSSELTAHRRRINPHRRSSGRAYFGARDDLLIG
jgi:hypothetical protein